MSGLILPSKKVMQIKIVYDDGLRYVEEQVNKLLEDGWRLHGNMFLKKEMIVQVLIKEVEIEVTV